MRRPAWLTLDLVIVLVFVVIGRAAHGHGDTFPGIVSTAWPFATGLVVGWTVMFVRRLGVVAVSSGVVASISTVGIGMILRVVAGQGTAVAFVFVALGFLGALMIGWRAVYLAIERLRSQRSVNLTTTITPVTPSEAP